MPFENYMIFEFEKMKGKNYIEIGEKKELKNIFDDPHIESQKKFIFQLFQGQGFNENSNPSFSNLSLKIKLSKLNVEVVINIFFIIKLLKLTLSK